MAIQDAAIACINAIRPTIMATESLASQKCRATPIIAIMIRFSITGARSKPENIRIQGSRSGRDSGWAIKTSGREMPAATSHAADAVNVAKMNHRS